MKKEITKTPSQFNLKVERAKLKIEKHAPEICVYSGITMMAGGAVSAAVATNKTSKILDQLDEQKMLIAEVHTDEKAIMEETKKASMKAGVKIAKAYTPSVLLTVGGGLSILKGFNIIKGRYAGVCTALAVAQQQIEDYRTKVIEEVGEEKEREIKTKASVKEEPIKPKGSIYQRMFDASSSEFRDNDANYNYAFIASVKAYQNEILQTRGHVFLNEVYDALGLSPTPEGQVLGWIKDGKGDGYIDFGLDGEECKDFVEGKSCEVLLDFNVDGVVYDLI